MMKKLLQIDNITYSTGINGRLVRVTTALEEGGILNVRGPSGSGKTTLLRIVARLKEAGEGSVFLEGRPWTEYSPVEWRRKVHYLAQKPAIFDGPVEANLKKPFELAAVKKEMRFTPERAQELLERLLLPTDLLTQDARTLSGGEASRLCLIRSILVDPVLLLLDEPLAALDRKAADAALGLIAEWVNARAGRGVLLVSHAGGMERLPSVAVLDIGEEEGDCR